MSVPGTEILEGDITHHLFAPWRKGVELSTNLGPSRRCALSCPASARGGGRSDERYPTAPFRVTCPPHDFPEESESTGGKLKFAGLYMHTSLWTYVSVFSSLSPEKKIFVVIFWFVVGFFFPIHTNSVGDFWKSFDVNEDFHEPGCTLEGVCSTSCGLRRLKSAMRCPGKCWELEVQGTARGQRHVRNSSPEALCSTKRDGLVLPFPQMSLAPQTQEACTY